VFGYFTTRAAFFAAWNTAMRVSASAPGDPVKCSGMALTSIARSAQSFFERAYLSSAGFSPWDSRYASAISFSVVNFFSFHKGGRGLVGVRSR
jgi:hypothetical protein